MSLRRYAQSPTYRDSVQQFMAPANVPMMKQQWYPTKYFSGCDVVFCLSYRSQTEGEDVPVLRGYMDEDIMDFQYTVMQPKRPIYSYASYRFDRVVLGQLLVVGSFAIPFTRKNRIFEELRSLGDASVSMPEIPAPNLVTPYTEDGLSLADKIALLQKGGLSSVAVMNNAQPDNPIDTKENTYSEIDRLGISPDGLMITTYYANVATSSNMSVGVDQGDPWSSLDRLPSTTAGQNTAGGEKIETIYKVYLNQKTKVIRPRGAPVLEQYEFVAWDVD